MVSVRELRSPRFRLSGWPAYRLEWLFPAPALPSVTAGAIYPATLRPVNQTAGNGLNRALCPSGDELFSIFRPTPLRDIHHDDLDSAFQPRFPAVSQLIPGPVRTDARCTSMLASSSHMEGAGELGCDLQDFR